MGEKPSQSWAVSGFVMPSEIIKSCFTEQRNPHPSYVCKNLPFNSRNNSVEETFKTQADWMCINLDLTSASETENLICQPSGQSSYIIVCRRWCHFLDSAPAKLFFRLWVISTGFRCSTEILTFNAHRARPKNLRLMHQNQSRQFAGFFFFLYRSWYNLPFKGVL